MGEKNTLSTEWINNSVMSYGHCHSYQLGSLHKKIWDHKTSAAHRKTNNIIETHNKYWKRM